ncbi:AzlC family ABC transporter permease [Corynebacterium uropygiale]|uniref:AzlC family ABC transporter permease n=1 Tax=Corynebacterium uropygiale TaxID=1775911 RepID=A0A9X1U8A9_9CORY|nr:AzlC family ABC transporter permease [Corynebacterium uropygiale]
MSRETYDDIRRAIRETWSVGLGLIPLGLAFGLVMTQAGFAWWWTPIFSTVIYAGSMEFLAVNLVGSGVGPISAAITGFLVNFRHIFYGLSFPRERIGSRVGRVYSTYALTDESYAIASVRAHAGTSGAWVLTVQILCQLLWLGSGIVGALAGVALPDSLQGMDFALTALFVVLAWEALEKNKDLSLPLIAAGLGILGAILVPQQMLIAALGVYALHIVARSANPRLDAALEIRRGRP